MTTPREQEQQEIAEIIAEYWEQKLLEQYILTSMMIRWECLTELDYPEPDQSIRLPLLNKVLTHIKTANTALINQLKARPAPTIEKIVPKGKILKSRLQRALLIHYSLKEALGAATENVTRFKDSQQTGADFAVVDNNEQTALLRAYKHAFRNFIYHYHGVDPCQAINTRIGQLETTLTWFRKNRFKTLEKHLVDVERAADIGQFNEAISSLANEIDTLRTLPGETKLSSAIREYQQKAKTQYEAQLGELTIEEAAAQIQKYVAPQPQQGAPVNQERMRLVVTSMPPPAPVAAVETTSTPNPSINIPKNVQTAITLLGKYEGNNGAVLNAINAISATYYAGQRPAETDPKHYKNVVSGLFSVGRPNLAAIKQEVSQLPDTPTVTESATL